MRKPHSAMGLRIRKARRNKDMTQSELADALAISVQSVSQWENGKTRPEDDRLRRLAEILGVSEAEILDGKPQTDKAPRFTSFETDLSSYENRIAPFIDKTPDLIPPISLLLDVVDAKNAVVATNPSQGNLVSYELSGYDDLGPSFGAGDIILLDNGVGLRAGDIVLVLHYEGDILEFCQVRGIRLDEADRNAVDLRRLASSGGDFTLYPDDTEDRVLATVVEHRRMLRR